MIKKDKINVNNLSFQQETRNIKQEVQKTASGITYQTVPVLRNMVNQGLNRIQNFESLINAQKSARDKLRRLWKSSGGGGRRPITAQDFLTQFSGKYGRSSLKSAADIENAYKVLQQSHDNLKLQKILIQANQTINYIRSKYQEQIHYGVSIYTENNGVGELWFTTYSSMEEILAQKNGDISRGALQLQYKSQELQNLLQEIRNQKTDEKYVNLLSGSEQQKLWGLLNGVKRVMNNKNISYSYGQLIEAFAYLSQNNNYTPKVDEVYAALQEGRNTLSWEKGGDFTMYEKEMHKSVEIQSKLFSVFDKSDYVHRISLTTVSGTKRVLLNIQSALNQNDINRINASLTEVFEKKENEGANHWSNQQTEKKIKTIIQEYLDRDFIIKS